MVTTITTHTLLNQYSLNGAYDEMWQGDTVRPHWQPLIQTLERLGPAELERYQQEARRLLRENGVTYNVHGAPDGLQRPWAFDIIPLVISEEDWRIIEHGLKQRAELLNLILTDLYGPRRLLREGRLPVELIYGHAGFLRQCDGVRHHGTHQLMLYAADLARGPDGRMWVLADRTQAPSGAGYALENRTVMAQIMRGMFKDDKIFRLSNFFRELRTALAELAPRKDSPRLVVMTPGPLNETYFEHAYLAAYLGYVLVQGDDLTVREGVVSLKTIEGLQPVDVILRRVDDTYCDPLELRVDSRLGVAGLLEAARRGNVAMVNPLGSGVLENPGLMPFLPGLAHYFLGEDLILPTAATWWCGQPKELNYVLNHLDKLVIKRIARQAFSRTVFGGQLSLTELTQLRDQIKANPSQFIGREEVGISTTPSLINGHLEARHAVMRCFSVGTASGYSVMPGSLTRSASSKDNIIVANWAGGVSKDTWILTSQPQQHTSLWLQTDRVETAYRSTAYLPSRAAENLFWVGRYAERAEWTARLLRTIFNLSSDGEPPAYEMEGRCFTILLRALTEVTGTRPGFIGKGSPARLARPLHELRSVALDNERIGSLPSNLSAMVQAAFAVRNLWSIDTWRVIDDLESPWKDLERRTRVSPRQIQAGLNQSIIQLMAFAGLNSESMTHEAGWLLLDIGRRLERALLSMTFIGAILGRQEAEAVQHLLLENLLTTTETVITYRRRYRSTLQLQTVLDLLLLDETNPRSLVFQLDRLQDHLAALPRERIAYRLSQEERLILDAATQLRLSHTSRLVCVVEETDTRTSLLDLLARLTDRLSRISEVLTQTYFSHAQVPHQLIVVQPDAEPS